MEGQSSQGSVCSSVKALRELGSERRETVEEKALLSKLQKDVYEQIERTELDYFSVI